jgi:hypothetical protein
MIHVHPVANGFGFTYVSESDIGAVATYVRQGDESQPWSQAEASHRADTVATMVGTHVVQNAEAPVIMLANGPKGQNCEVCGNPIPPTGKRGRPRKVHAECAEQAKAAKLPATGVPMLDEGAATMEFTEMEV